MKSDGANGIRILEESDFVDRNTFPNFKYLERYIRAYINQEIGGWLNGKSSGLVTVRTSVQIQVMTGHPCECELLTFILAPITPTRLRLRKPIKQDGRARIELKKQHFLWFVSMLSNYS